MNLNLLVVFSIDFQAFWLLLWALVGVRAPQPPHVDQLRPTIGEREKENRPCTNERYKDGLFIVKSNNKCLVD